MEKIGEILLKILTISENDVKQLLSMEECVKANERAFKLIGQSKGAAAPRSKILIKEYGWLATAIPGYADDVYGFKLLSSGGPYISSLVILYDSKEGSPIAFINSRLLSGMRTGAGGGVAAKYLARKDSKVIAVIGTGFLSRHQLLAINEVVSKPEKILVFSRKEERRRSFIDEIKNKVKCNIHAVSSAFEAVKDADIIVVATRATAPAVLDEWVRQGSFISTIGSFEEVDPKVLLRAKSVVDSWDRASGDGIVGLAIKNGVIKRENVYAELGEIVAGKKVGRTSDREITLFDSIGLGTQDIVSAKVVYDKAKEVGAGRWIEMDLEKYPQRLM